MRFTEYKFMPKNILLKNEKFNIHSFDVGHYKTTVTITCFP